MELDRRRADGRPAGGRGMTLIEVVVAAAVVLTVVIAASSAVSGVDGASVRASGREAAEAKGVAAEIEVLRSLPFAAASPALGPTDLVSRVFPHADPGRDTPDAAFAPEPCDGCPAATFFTVRAAPGGRLTIAATFVVDTADGWTPVGAARLAGYDATRALELPSAALLLRVTVAWRAGARSGVVGRSAIVADRSFGICRVAAPASPGPT